MPNGLETVIDKNSQLSTGQKKKVHIIRSLMRNTVIYMWDEPTANLDDKSKIVFWKIIEQMHKSKINIVVSHDGYSRNNVRVVDFGEL